MTWLKVDDKRWGDPQWLAMTPRARGIWTTAGSWSADHLTDGYVPRHMLAVFGGRAGDAAELVARGWWKPAHDGWEFVDWLEDQPSREQVLAERAAAKDRQRRARVKAKKSRRDSGVSHAVTDAVTSGEVTVPPTRPDLEGRVGWSPTAAAAASVSREISPERQQQRIELASSTPPVAWDLDGEGWRIVDEAIDRCGVVLVATVAANRAGKNPPGSARAWIPLWANLMPKPAPPRQRLCDDHDLPMPCRSCAADAKAAQ